jgi:hypothetical protein
MLHTIAGLITYLIILAGTRLWPEQETSVCSCAYGGLVLFYAVMLTFQMAWSLQDSRAEPSTLQDNDLRANLPWYAAKKISTDLRRNSPAFSDRGAL